MRFVIIGYGLLSSLIYESLKKKKKVLVLSRFKKSKHSLTNKDFFYYDINNLDQIEKKIKKDDIILFSAGPSEFELSKLNKKKISEYLYFYNEIIKLCIKVKVSQFIFFSSIKVYSKSKIYDEQAVTKATSKYSLLKINCEKIITNYYPTTTKFKIIRISNVFSEPLIFNKNYENLLIPSLIKSSLIKKSICLKNPEICKDFLTFHDFNKKLIKVINDKDINQMKVYNVGSYNSISILDISLLIQKIIYKLYKIKINLRFPNRDKTTLIFNTKFLFLRTKSKINNLEIAITKLILFLKDHYKN